MEGFSGFHVIWLLDVTMSKTVILDSYPSASINFPTYVPLNNSPPLFPRKHKGQPLLGQRQARYTHFIPMRDESSQVKDLLTIQDTETSEPEKIQGYQQLLKNEKIITGEEPNASTTSAVVDTSFKNEAKEYIQTANTYTPESYQGKDEVETITQKNDSQIATIIAAAAKPKPRVSRAKSSRKPPKKKKKATPKNQR